MKQKLSGIVMVPIAAIALFLAYRSYKATLAPPAPAVDTRGAGGMAAGGGAPAGGMMRGGPGGGLKMGSMGAGSGGGMMGGGASKAAPAPGGGMGGP